jgi:hypothetical protein
MAIVMVGACSTPPSSGDLDPPASITMQPSSVAAGPTASITAHTDERLVDHIALDDPSIEMTLPVGWREVTVDEWMQDIQGLPEGASLGDGSFVSRLESGQILTTAEGFTDSAINVQVEVSLARNAKNLQEALSSIADVLARTREVEGTETGAIEAQIGTVAWARYLLRLTGTSDTALPAHLLAYIVQLGSDGILVIHSAGVQSDASHHAILDEMISTLRPNDRLGSLDRKGLWLGRVEGTDLRFVYPETFVPVPLDGLRDSLAEYIRDGSPGAGPEAQRIVDAIDDGVLRAQMSSHKPLGVGRTLKILVHRDTADIDSAVRRSLEDFGDPEVLSRLPFTLPIGDAVRLRLSVPNTSIPAIDDLFVLALADDSSLTISGRAALDDQEFEVIMNEFAKSFEQM